MEHNAPCPWCHTTEFLRLIHMVEELEVTVRVTCDFCSSIGPKRLDARDAWVAWDLMERSEWRDKPTEPGWYFYRVPGQRNIHMMQITPYDLEARRKKALVWDMGDYEWQGPIQPKE